MIVALALATVALAEPTEAPPEPRVERMALSTPTARLLAMDREQCVAGGKKQVVAVPRDPRLARAVHPPGLSFGHFTTSIDQGPGRRRFRYGDLEVCWEQPQSHLIPALPARCGRSLALFRTNGPLRIYTDMTGLAAGLPTCMFETAPTEDMAQMLESLARPDRKAMVGLLVEWEYLRFLGIPDALSYPTLTSEILGKRCVRGRCVRFVEVMKRNMTEAAQARDAELGPQPRQRQ